jgi:hypothetical protein
MNSLSLDGAGCGGCARSSSLKVPELGLRVASSAAVLWVGAAGGAADEGAGAAMGASSAGGSGAGRAKRATSLPVSSPNTPPCTHHRPCSNHPPELIVN